MFDKIAYSQNWLAYNQAQQREKQLFMELLNELCKTVEEPKYTFGRPKLPIADMLFCSVFKVYSTFSGRRFTSDMKTAEEKEYILKVPHYNSIFNHLRDPKLTPILRHLIEQSALPLKSIETNFAVDSSGFTSTKYMRWFDFKYGKQSAWKIWLKVHLMCGVRTNVVTSVEVTDGNVSDTPQLPELVTRTAKNFDVKEVVADKGYSSRENYEAIRKIGASGYIPFRSNATGRAGRSALWKKMFHYFMYNREEFMQHYHKRSNVETTFHMIKSKFGTNLRSKTRTAQINEVLCKILCHNICVLIQEMHELGVEYSGDDYEKQN